ncbi:hypothetical protein V8F44DRAFT_600167, partial [Aspergillus fumigatus]
MLILCGMRAIVVLAALSSVQLQDISSILQRPVILNSKGRSDYSIVEMMFQEPYVGRRNGKVRPHFEGISGKNRFTKGILV